MKFDPHQYAIDAGWDRESIEKTAELGVADRDEEIIREIAAEQGLSGDELEDAAVEATSALLRFCKQRVAE